MSVTTVATSIETDALGDCSLGQAKRSSSELRRATLSSSGDVSSTPADSRAAGERSQRADGLPGYYLWASSIVAMVAIEALKRRKGTTDGAMSTTSKMSQGALHRLCAQESVISSVSPLPEIANMSLHDCFATIKGDPISCSSLINRSNTRCFGPRDLKIGIHET